MAEKPSYRRVLLKISGEALMGRREFGLDPNMLDQIARDVKEVGRARRQTRRCSI